METGFEKFPWIAPWQPISERGREAYAHELALEVTPGHPLFGVPAVPVARLANGDDVLFALPEHPAPLAVVHLTFIGRPEIKPHWPVTTLYSGIDHWVSRRMMPDVARFETEGFREAA